MRDLTLPLNGSREVPPTLTHIRHDALLQVNEEFQSVHERLAEEAQLREASEERVVESLEVFSGVYQKGVDVHRL